MSTFNDDGVIEPNENDFVVKPYYKNSVHNENDYEHHNKKVVIKPYNTVGNYKFKYKSDSYNISNDFKLHTTIVLNKNEVVNENTDIENVTNTVNDITFRDIPIVYEKYDISKYGSGYFI